MHTFLPLNVDTTYTSHWYFLKIKNLNLLRRQPLNASDWKSQVVLRRQLYSVQPCNVARLPIFKMEFLSDSRSSYSQKCNRKPQDFALSNIQATSQRPTRKVVTPTQLRLRQQQSWFVNILNGKIKNWICHLTLISVTTRFIRLTLSRRDGWW